MYISLDWISDYVDLSGLDINSVASRLTLATAEVEGVETLVRNVKGVLVGQIIEAEVVKNEPEHKLTRVVVDCGIKKYHSVCGAPNCVLGMKVAFAPVGVTLNGDALVKEAVVGGFPSSGVCCSARELGLSKWHEGVLEIPADIPNGALLSDYIPETDTLIEIDNKSLTHRPDLWGHYGFAREFAAVFGKELKALPQTDLNQYNNLSEFPIKIDDLENCPCYGCIGFEAPKIPVTPLVMQRRLHAIGQRTMGLLVDVTNYCMFDLGQPTHAFDGDFLNSVRIDSSKVEREFTTLDGQKRTILPEDLLIWNEDRPVALAGVMGGLETEIKPTTKRMLLECANFKAARIRRTSVRLDLRSDAAQRYEKSQPPINVKVAAGRILNLLADAKAEIIVTTRWSMDGSLDDQFRYIEMTPNRFDTLAGIQLPHEKISAILESLGFTAEFTGASDSSRLKIGIPPFRARKDISIPEDIVEEVLRVYGYDNIAPVMPSVPARALYIDAPLRTEHKARRTLALGHGFAETHNYCWFDENWINALGLKDLGIENYVIPQPGEAFEQKSAVKPMEFANPSASQYRFLRTTLMPNLLALVGKNRQYRDAFRLFEIGHTFFDTGEKSCREKVALAGVAYQTPAGGTLEDLYRSVKGAVEDLSKIWFEKPAEFEVQSAAQYPWQQPGCWIAIKLNGKIVGSMGYLEGDLLHTVVSEGGQVVWFEIDLDAINADIFPTAQYEAIPVFPGSWADFSLVWSLDAGYGKLDKVLSEFSHPLLTSRTFIGCYKGKGMEPGTGSYTFRTQIGAADHTLTGEEIEEFRAAWLNFLKEKGIALRQ